MLFSYFMLFIFDLEHFFMYILFTGSNKFII
nr:MAG TPA: hypothetical protein [Caudoviricetes sp.]